MKLNDEKNKKVVSVDLNEHDASNQLEPSTESAPKKRSTRARKVVVSSDESMSQTLSKEMSSNENVQSQPSSNPQSAPEVKSESVARAASSIPSNIKKNVVSVPTPISAVSSKPSAPSVPLAKSSPSSLQSGSTVKKEGPDLFSTNSATSESAADKLVGKPTSAQQQNAPVQQPHMSVKQTSSELKKPVEVKQDVKQVEAKQIVETKPVLTADKPVDKMEGQTAKPMAEKMADKSTDKIVDKMPEKSAYVQVTADKAPDRATSRQVKKIAGNDQPVEVKQLEPKQSVEPKQGVPVAQSVQTKQPVEIKRDVEAKKDFKKDVELEHREQSFVPHEPASQSYDEEYVQPRSQQQQTHQNVRYHQGQSRSHQGGGYHQNQARSHQGHSQGHLRNTGPSAMAHRNAQQQQQPRVQPQPPQENKDVPMEEMSLTELVARARRYGIIGASLISKEKLIEKIKHAQEHPDREMAVEGVLEKLPDGFGFLRSSSYDYVSGPDDIYVSPSQIRRFHLRTGDTVTGVIRNPKEGEKYFALLKVDKVNFSDPSTTADRAQFDQLTPLHPNKKLNLEFDPNAISTRVMDMFTPIGKGQRGLIVAPPKVGKTLLLKEITLSLVANHKEIQLIVLLIDERPEEVADIKRAVRGTSAEVISSTFDESAERHVQVAERVLEKAKRLVESGKDVVILLDSITRLARAYNTVAPASGKVLTGGIDANALHYPKRFFGAARTTEEAGSLTIIASALIDTGSRMDEVIFEEFKGTGNMEIHMSRKLAHRRIYPAFDLMVSGTRRDDLLHTAEDLNKVWVLQKFLSTMGTAEGMEFMIDKMKKFKTNEEFLESMNKKQQ